MRAAPQPAPVPPVERSSRVGVRVVSYTVRDVRRHSRLDPAAYRCGVLAAQLADEVVAYADGAPTSVPVSMMRAVRDFLRFVDARVVLEGGDAASVRLDGGPVDVTELLFAWESDLRARYRPSSDQPAVKANGVLTLLGRRALWDAAMPEKLVARTRAPALFARVRATPLDEFTNAERLALQDAARAGVRAAEARLAAARPAGEGGRDPYRHGWGDFANLLWAAREGTLSVDALCEGLGSGAQARWPESLRIALDPSGGPYARPRRAAAATLVRAASDAVFARDEELQAFRVLLLLTTGCAPEELLDLRVSDVEFGDGGVRVSATKARAGRVRVRWHPSRGRWDTAGLLRRLVDLTEPVRAAHPDCRWLFAVAHLPRGRPDAVRAGPARFGDRRRTFGAWIAGGRDADGGPLNVSLPHDIRRLRKTAKTAKVVALGGTLTDLAGDDHHVEVFRGHYAHGTTAHVLAGRAITTAQERMFARAVRAPTFLDGDAVDHLADARVSAALGMSPAQATTMRVGDLDMGLTHCRDPYDSPFAPGRSLCHVAPAMCLLCRNAVVFTAQLPRLVLMADHIERMRAVLAPAHWQAVWGAQAAALEELFRECADLLPAAREEAAAAGTRLDLPLGMRTEYDR
ncbi:hypothetical protein [Embleya sp. NPDC005971]|uniref:hypothetical protein n=1 Tax=Embleya sp. NPDC005971 TaxID=3156724 RepID=UPI0033D4C673